MREYFFWIVIVFGKKNICQPEIQIDPIKSYLEGLESERFRLSKELHDNVSNGLLSLEMQLKTGKYSLEEAYVLIEQLRSQVRGISHELSPPVFVAVTLPEIIEDYVQLQNQITNIHFQAVIKPKA